jgi:hypothetical protein
VRKNLPIILAICLLCGCAMLNRHSRVSSDLNSVSVGQWCRVEMSEIRGARVRAKTEHTGRIDYVDGDFITLSDVTSDFRMIRGFRRNAIGPSMHSGSMTLPRERIVRITPISPPQAESLPQPQ